MQNGDWQKLVEVYDICTYSFLGVGSIQQSTCTTPNEVNLPEEFHLRVRQSTFIEEVDKFVAAVARISVDISEIMENDKVLKSHNCQKISLKDFHGKLTVVGMFPNVTMLLRPPNEKSNRLRCTLHV